jgi:hypothetical protein
VRFINWNVINAQADRVSTDERRRMGIASEQWLRSKPVLGCSVLVFASPQETKLHSLIEPDRHHDGLPTGPTVLHVHRWRRAGARLSLDTNRLRVMPVLKPAVTWRNGTARRVHTFSAFKLGTPQSTSITGPQSE